MWKRFATPDDVEAWTTRPEAWARFVETAEHAWPNLLDLVGRMHRAGIDMIVGTDLANPYGVAGFSGIDDRLGAIHEGKDASFFLGRENSLTELRAARSPEVVWVRGSYFYRSALVRLAGGTLEWKYESWGEGSEELAVARTAAGVTTYTFNRQRGFGRVPTQVETTHDDAGAIRSLAWITFAHVPTSCELMTRSDGTRVLSIAIADEEIELPVAAADVDLLPPIGVAGEA